MSVASNAAPGTRWIGVGALLLILCARTSVADDELSIDVLGKQFSGQTRSLLATPGESRTVYLGTPDGYAYYIHDPATFYHLRSDQSVEIRRISGGSDLVVVEFRSPRFGTGRIYCFPAPGNELENDLVQAMIEDALPLQSAARPRIQAIGNRESLVVHARGSNHLPALDSRAEFPSPEEGVALGYKKCPVCYPAYPAVSEPALEAELGRMAAAQVVARSPIAYDDAQQSRVTRIGQQVLAKWPTDLRGYEYSFALVVDDQPNAMACPGGKVFITTGLLGAIESDKELESLLAHEIAHVERRHGYRMYKRAVRASDIGSFLGVMGGLGIGAATGSIGIGAAAFSSIAVLASVAATIVLAGYGRNEEEEADTYALAYSERSGDVDMRAAFAQVLAKLQYARSFGGVATSVGGGPSTHPDIATRIDRIRHADVELMDPPLVFEARDADNELVLLLSLDCQEFADYEELRAGSIAKVADVAPGFGTAGPKRYETRAIRGTSQPRRELHLFVSAVGSEQLKIPIRVRSIVIRSNGQDLSLDNREDTEVFPVLATGFNFVSSQASGLLQLPIEIVSIDAPRVARIVPLVAE